MRVFIGIDNGVSGSIGIITELNNGETISDLYPTPVKKSLNYTKSKAFLNRIDGEKLKELLYSSSSAAEKVTCLIERPMVNPGRWIATMSAMRALEATLIVLEMSKIPYQFVDSKEWQRVLLPSGLWVKREIAGPSGKKKMVIKADPQELKLAAVEVAKRKYPTINLDWGKVKDADGLMIAEFCRLKLALQV